MRREAVGAHDALELGRVGIGDALPAAGDAGVVHEDVDAAEVGDDRVDQLLAILEPVDRAGIGLGAAAEALDLAHDFLGGLGVAAVVHRDVGAVPRQSQRDLAPDAAAPAGYQCNASLKSPLALGTHAACSFFLV